MTQPQLLFLGCCPTEDARQKLQETLQQHHYSGRLIQADELDLPIAQVLEREIPDEAAFDPVTYPETWPKGVHPVLVFINVEGNEAIVDLHKNLAPCLKDLAPDYVGRTEGNSKWTFRELLQHLIGEKRYMQLFFGLQNRLELLSDLEEKTYTASSWMRWKQARDQALETLNRMPPAEFDELLACARELEQAFSSLATQG